MGKYIERGQETILVEMKSKGKDLNKAFIQAKEYTQNLKSEEIPKYILVSDFDCHLEQLFRESFILLIRRRYNYFRKAIIRRNYFTKNK